MDARAGSSRKLPKDSHTIPFKGVGDDDGKLFRCWNCGFICRSDRDELGGGSSRSGVVIVEYVESPDTVDSLSYLACLDGCESFYQTTPKAYADGVTPQPSRHAMKVSEASSGCPLCHSLNWRGDY